MQRQSTAFLLVTLVAAVASAAPTHAELEAGRSQSKAAEARANLKAVYTAEKAYFSERDTYRPEIATVGFAPERGNRYTYYLATSGVIERRNADVAASSPRAVIIALDEKRYPAERLHGRFAETGCPLTQGESGGRQVGLGVTGGVDGDFIIAAAGNIDSDAELDCWSIASVAREAADGRAIPAGEPFHERSDFDESLAAKAAVSLKGPSDDLDRIGMAISQAWERRGEKPKRFSELGAGLPSEDPWGNRFILIPARGGGEDAVVLAAAGPDKELGTEDDWAFVLTQKDAASLAKRRR